MEIKYWSILLINYHYLVLLYRIYGSSPYMPSLYHWYGSLLLLDLFIYPIAESHLCT